MDQVKPGAFYSYRTVVLCLLLAGCVDKWTAVTPEAYASAERACAPNDGLGWLSTESYGDGEEYKVKARCRNGLLAEFWSKRRAIP